MKFNPDHELYEVNFAVSNICNANCLFCPRSFINHGNKFMSVELVKRVMEEVTSPQFAIHHKVVHSVCSENGEPFLNPNILDILRTVRSAKLGITMFSNFGVLTPDIAETVIKERLFDSIHVNIDGASPLSYAAVKGIDLQTTWDNLHAFIRIRNARKAPIRILVHVISHYTYTEAVKLVYGIPPVKFRGKEYPQDGPLAVELYRLMLNSELDGIGEDSVMFWAERYNNHPVAVPDNFGCPNLGRVKHVAYINPDGDWYACCFDAGNDLVIGNVNEHSLLDLSVSERRMILISQLEERKWEAIGFPCTRIDSCNGLNRSEVKP
jgi:hypothetical protein